MVNIAVKNYNQIDLTDSLFVVGVQDDISTDLGYLDKMPSGDLCKKITSAVKNIKEIPKKFGKSLLFFCEGENNTYIKILLLGIGKYSELDSTKIRQLGGIISIKAKELQCMKIIISDFYKPVLKMWNLLLKDFLFLCMSLINIRKMLMIINQIILIYVRFIYYLTKIII